GAVLGGDVDQIARRPSARRARHVLGDDAGSAWDVLAVVARQRARVDVIAAGGPRPEQKGGPTAGGMVCPARGGRRPAPPRGEGRVGCDGGADGRRWIGAIWAREPRSSTACVQSAASPLRFR